ncbi:MAG: hypothetical protein LBB41_05810 [Prevotellaceae bacterium]|jgi:hypothetical protein|nr:hypothetical protein [Prevotellaceae bacterium]
MNLFWKKLFGQLHSTARFEQNELDILAAMKRYDEVEKSVELAEYRDLFHTVKAAKFQENKKILQNRKYRDTQECRDWKKLEKLQRNPDIKRYHHTAASEPLKLFLTFKETSDYELLGDPKQVKQSMRLQELKKFERSKEYKNYVRFHNSYIIKELEDLKDKTATSEFQRANEFWANPHRWESTPEYAQEQRFYTLAKNADIEFFNNEKPERFAELRKRKSTFSQEFDLSTVSSIWKFGFHYVAQQLIGNHSFTNEKQANNHGKNTMVENGVLKIVTKHEKVKTIAWDTVKGFVEKEFDFTADAINTADSFRQEYGIFQAKIRCSGNFHHAFWLGAEGKLPHINIFHYNGKRVTVGNASKDTFDGTEIKGINPYASYIYTLVWKKDELLWYINNIEVYRTRTNIPKEKLYIALNSFISNKQHGANGSLEVDWIRVYSIHN